MPKHFLWFSHVPRYILMVLSSKSTECIFSGSLTHHHSILSASNVATCFILKQFHGKAKRLMEWFPWYCGQCLGSSWCASDYWKPILYFSDLRVWPDFWLKYLCERVVKITARGHFKGSKLSLFRRQNPHWIHRGGFVAMECWTQEMHSFH